MWKTKKARGRGTHKKAQREEHIREQGEEDYIRGQKEEEHIRGKMQEGYIRRQIGKKLCEQKEGKILKAEACPKHTHISVRTPPHIRKCLNLSGILSRGISKERARR